MISASSPTTAPFSAEIPGNEWNTLPPPASNDAQDIAWMEAIKRGGDEAMAAFEALVEAHHVRVINLVAKMLGGDATEAEDIAQQVFIRVWNSASRYEPGAKFTTWLYTIVRNLVFNECRRRRRHPLVSLEREESQPVLNLPDFREKSPDKSLLDEEMYAAIEKAIAALPEMQRMAIVLRRYQDVSYEEIAKILDVSVPSVKSLLFRARTELRARLKHYLEGV